MRGGRRRSPGGLRARAPEGHRLATDAEQGSTEDRQLALSLRDEGTGDAMAAASLQAREALEAALDRLIAGGRPFTADDLRDLVDVDRLPLSGTSQVVGAVFLLAAKAGRIVKVGYRPSTRPSSHGRVVAVWDHAR